MDDDVQIKAPLPESSSGEFEEESKSSTPEINDADESENDNSESSLPEGKAPEITGNEFCNVSLDFDPE